MACERWSDKLDSYVDGELSLPEANELGTHLRGCSGCAAQALERVQMKRSVADAGKYFEPSSEFRKKIEKNAHKASKRNIIRGWQIVALPAALVLIISLAMGFYVNREKANRERVYGELADLHVATLASTTPVDVLSSDKHTVKPWFEGKIPFTFNLPELQGTDFELVGGRIAYMGQTPGAHLIYRLRKHELSVFIFQDRGVEMASWASDPTSMLSFTFQTWAKNGLRYFVVGDVSGADVDALTRLLRDAG
jgi:anti-sigma factor RsiW